MIDRKQKPTPTGEIKFSLPIKDKFNLKSGLEVCFVEKNSLPIVQFGLLINTGSKDDAILGTASLTTKCIDEGAGEFNSLELDNQIELLGSILDISTHSENTLFLMLSLQENFSKSAKLFSTIINSPHFSLEDFNLQKEKTLTELHQLKEETSFIASLVFQKLIFKDSLYANSTLGTLSEVDKIATNDIKNFYKKNYHLEDSLLVVVGNTKREEIENIFNDGFSLTGTSSPDNYFTPSNEEAFSKIFFVEKESSVQSQIRVGHLSNINRNGKDFFKSAILDVILGGITGRINLNLRENKGYTYGAYSSFNFRKSNSYLVVNTSVEDKNTGKALQEIFNELELITKEIKKEEVDFAKSSLIKKYPSNFETYSQVVLKILSQKFYNLPEDYYNTYIENINNCDRNGILNFAKQNILNQQMTAVVVGNKKAKDDLKNIFGNKNIVDVEIDDNII